VKTSNSSSCCLSSSYLTGFFRVLNIFARVFLLKASKLQFDQNTSKAGNVEAKKPTFACPPFTFAIFSLKCGEKNVGKLLILYLSHKNVFCFHFVIANVEVCLLLSREGGRPQKAQNATAITKLKNQKTQNVIFKAKIRFLILIL